MTPPTAQRKNAAGTATGIRNAGLVVSQNFTKKHHAAILLAEDYLSDEEIADNVGVTRRTLANWKNDPEFAALVGDYHGQVIAQALKVPVARVHDRTQLRQRMVDDILQGIDLRAERMKARADSPEESARRVFGSTTPPEAATGWYVERAKIAASGKTVTDYELDTGAIKAINDLLNDAAKDLGQTTQNINVDGMGAPVIQIFGMADEDLP